MKNIENVNSFASVPESPRLVVFHIPQEESTDYKQSDTDSIGINTDDNNYDEDSKLILDETNMRILINMNNKIERMSIRVKQILDNNNTCIDCLCRCFSCASFILSIVSILK